jgi:hypothetical protein
MSSPLSQYSDNMDWARKEFKLDPTTNLYDIVNILVSKYRELLNNQPTKESEDGTRAESRRKGK